VLRKDQVSWHRLGRVSYGDDVMDANMQNPNARSSSSSTSSTSKKKKKKKNKRGRKNKTAFDAVQDSIENQGFNEEDARALSDEVHFQYIKICVLRDYLGEELRMTRLPFEWDVERVIDDFVFLCFFVGNDFLPHLPALDIKNDAIDFLVMAYKKVLPSVGGYLTDCGVLDLERVDVLIAEIASQEGNLFRIMHEKSEKRSRHVRGRIQKALQALNREIKHENARKEHADSEKKGPENEYRLEAALQRSLVKSHEDKVKLHMDGYLDRYYATKLGADRHGDGKVVVQDLCRAYIEGLQWVLAYYYRGCPSWTWYFPFHYAPMASSLRNCDEYAVAFDHDPPVSCITQLMSVLPRQSAHCLPPACRALMTEETSPILEYYPTEFDIDLNGKPYLWMGVVLLPFMDAAVLHKHMVQAREAFTENEKHRDSTGRDFLMCAPSHSLLQSQRTEKETKSGSLTRRVSHVHFQGTVAEDTSVIQDAELDAVCFSFELPAVRGGPVRAQLLPGVELPSSLVDDEDSARVREWTKIALLDQSRVGGKKTKKNAKHAALLQQQRQGAGQMSESDSEEEEIARQRDSNKKQRLKRKRLESQQSRELDKKMKSEELHASASGLSRAVMQTQSKPFSFSFKK
jgi:5'-3' exonuclease